MYYFSAEPLHASFLALPWRLQQSRSACTACHLQTVFSRQRASAGRSTDQKEYVLSTHTYVLAHVRTKTNTSCDFIFIFVQPQPWRKIRPPTAQAAASLRLHLRCLPLLFPPIHQAMLKRVPPSRRLLRYSSKCRRRRSPRRRRTLLPPPVPPLLLRLWEAPVPSP